MGWLGCGVGSRGGEERGGRVCMGVLWCVDVVMVRMMCNLWRDSLLHVHRHRKAYLKKQTTPPKHKQHPKNTKDAKQRK